MAKYPKNYMALQKMFPDLIKSFEKAGSAAKKSGPLNAKTCHLIQLAACAALRSEGGVHSHTRRAFKECPPSQKQQRAIQRMPNVPIRSHCHQFGRFFNTHQRWITAPTVRFPYLTQQ